MKQTVEAKSRKLSARWTFEAAQDAQSQHGIDVEAEIMAALAQEITAEIDQEVIASLTSLAGTAPETYDQNAVSGTATFVGDEHAALAVSINRVSNLIAQRTRRGAGNLGCCITNSTNTVTKCYNFCLSHVQQKVLSKHQPTQISWYIKQRNESICKHICY